MGVPNQAVEVCQEGGALCQLIEGAGFDQAFQRALVQVAGIHPFEQVLNSQERPTLRSRFDNALCDALPDVLYAGETETNRLRAVFGAL